MYYVLDNVTASTTTISREDNEIEIIAECFSSQEIYSDVLKGERYNYACTFFDRVQGENPM